MSPHSCCILYSFPYTFTSRSLNSLVPFYLRLHISRPGFSFKGHPRTLRVGRYIWRRLYFPVPNIVSTHPHHYFFSSLLWHIFILIRSHLRTSPFRRRISSVVPLFPPTRFSYLAYSARFSLHPLAPLSFRPRHPTVRLSHLCNKRRLIALALKYRILVAPTSSLVAAAPWISKYPRRSSQLTSRPPPHQACPGSLFLILTHRITASHRIVYRYRIPSKCKGSARTLSLCLFYFSSQAMLRLSNFPSPHLFAIFTSF